MSFATSDRPALRLVTEPVAEPASPALAAIELLPGRVRAALVDLSGVVLRRAETTYPRSTTDRAAIDTALTAAIQQCFDQAKPMGVGVAAAGLLDADAGVIIEVNDVPALRGYPVAELLGRLLRIPVYVEHRARLQVLGDRWFGPGRGRSTFASVSTGEVLGVGILYEGQVLAPPGGRSGAHMTVAASGRPCTCGARGCWKTIATTPWLRAEAARRGFGPAATVRGLAERARVGDTVAGAVLDAYADNLALGLVNIQQLFAPGLFVLHGEAGDGGERFRVRIERSLRLDSSWATSAEPPCVLVSDGAVDDIALLGGAGLVLTKN